MSKLDLEQQRKRAKDLRKAHARGDADAIRRVAQHRLAVAKLTLAQAQLVIAREAGFDSWPKLKRALGGNDPFDAALAGERVAVAAIDSIWLAAVLGDAPRVRQLLDADPSLANERGGPREWTPLLYACCARYGHDDPSIVAARVTIARELLARGADVDARGRETWFTTAHVDGFDVEHWHALAGAAGRVGSPELVETLLAAKPTIEYAEHLLKHAVWSNNLRVLELALAAKPPWWHVIWALELCAALDLPIQARMLVPHAASPKALEPALLRAIRDGRSIELVTILLGDDEPSQQRRLIEDNVYRAARRYQHDAAAELLRARGASESIIRPEDLVIPPATDDAGEVVDDERIDLFERAADAVAAGDLDALRELLDGEPDLVRLRSPRGHRCSLLHYTAANGTEDPRQRTPPNAHVIAELLLERGADPNATCKLYGGGATAMGLMVTSVHPKEPKLDGELARVYAKYGAKITQGDVDIAVQYASPLALRALVDAGAPITLLVAAALDLPLPDDIDINTRFGDGYTALHAAAGMGHERLVKELLDRGADKTLVDARWNGTAADKARHFGHDALADFIDRS